MENGDIKDEQLSASTQWVSPPSRSGKPPIVYGAKNARLKNTREPAPCWTPANHNQNKKQWLQVNFGHPYTKITRIATQGNPDADEWVTEFKLQYSDDGQIFHYYKEQGQNTDKVSIHTVTRLKYN